MERINITIVKNNAKSCEDAVNSLKTSAANFSGELESLSTVWNSASATNAKNSMDSIMDNLDSVLSKFNSINEKINQVASDIEIVDQTSLENQSKEEIDEVVDTLKSVVKQKQ